MPEDLVITDAIEDKLHEDPSQQVQGSDIKDNIRDTNLMEKLTADIPLQNHTNSETLSPTLVKKREVGLGKSSRRRSTIFQKRAAIPEDDSPILTQEENVEPSPEEVISFDEYVKKLKEENNTWSTTVRERKREYKRVSKLKPEVITFESISHLLSEADKKFISERPDYAAIAQKVKELPGNVLICNTMKRKADNTMRAVMRVKVEEKLEDIQAHILSRDK